MKLLFVTQTIDRDDPILGFVHRWVDVFSAHIETITVICLNAGAYQFPANVRVISLGKEHGRRSKWWYGVRFLGLIWKHRSDYDRVFVHMNEEYVLIGGFLWRFMGKRIALWRNHPIGTWMTPIAMMLTHRLFCTSPQSFIARSKRTQLMPAGIDTDAFVPSSTTQRDPKKIVMAGRINEAYKRTHVLIDACIQLIRTGNEDWLCDVIGAADVGSEEYLERLKKRVRSVGLEQRIHFLPPVPNRELVSVYQSAGIAVNTTQSGSLDKALLEAMAAGCLTVTSNVAFVHALPEMCICNDGDATDLARRLNIFLRFGEAERTSLSGMLRDYVVEHHSLKRLASDMIERLT